MKKSLFPLQRPLIMGILNVTPDSFSDGGKYTTTDKALSRAEEIIKQGGDIIDVGGYSSRPGAPDVPIDEELRRTIPKIEAIRKKFPEIPISIDTFRAKVAEEALQAGANLINDISGFQFDSSLLKVLTRYKPPYILMHIQGTPQTMQKNPSYEDVVRDVWKYFVKKIRVLRENGVREIIIDPGFGFGKTLEHNKKLFQNLSVFTSSGFPVLIGISRKSWMQKTLNASAENLIPAMSVLHFQALRQGVKILRVHDVAEAKQVVKLFEYLRN